MDDIANIETKKTSKKDLLIHVVAWEFCNLFFSHQIRNQPVHKQCIPAIFVHKSSQVYSTTPEWLLSTNQPLKHSLGRYL